MTQTTNPRLCSLHSMHTELTCVPCHPLSGPVQILQTCQDGLRSGPTVQGLCACRSLSPCSSHSTEPGSSSPFRSWWPSAVAGLGSSPGPTTSRLCTQDSCLHPTSDLLSPTEDGGMPPSSSRASIRVEQGNVSSVQLVPGMIGAW